MIKQTENRANISVIAPARSLLAVAKGTIEAYIFLIVCFFALAIIYTYTKMPDSWLNPTIKAISALSLLLAGFESSRRVKRMGYLHGALSGLVCSLVRIFLGIAIYKSYVPTDSPLKTILTAVLISTLGGIAGINCFARKK